MPAYKPNQPRGLPDPPPHHAGLAIPHGYAKYADPLTRAPYGGRLRGCYTTAADTDALSTIRVNE